MTADNQRLDLLVKKLDSSALKAELGNKGLQQLVSQSQANGSKFFEVLKSFAEKDPARVQDMFDRYQAYLGAKGICFHDAAGTAGAGSIYQPALAPYFKQKYASLDPKERGVKIYTELLREAVKGIGFHEIGHSIGMRHNFSSSWDSPNYAPQYWQLRTNEGKSVAACPAGGRSGAADSCMGPRYLDPVTEDEQGLTPAEPRPGLEYFANTSTMEYQIERFGETAGAGTYDLHFMKTIYGRVLETFDEREVKPETQQYFAVKTLSQGIPSDLVFVPNVGYGVHYTKGAVIAKVFNPTRDCREATSEERETAKWRIVHGKVCSQSPKNHLAYDDMKSSEISFTTGKSNTSIGVNGVRWSGTDENGAKLIRWHYRYGEDYSRGGYIHAKLFDSGADIYETTVNVTRRFDVTYPWQYFRRLNKEYAWWSLANSVDSSTFARLRAYHWNTTTDIGRSRPEDLANPDQDQPAVYASNEMFNFLQRAILMPEPGNYAVGPDTSRRTPSRPGAKTIFDLTTADESPTSPFIGKIGIIDGRYVQTDFDNDRGGSWDYFHFPNYVGFDDEKTLAIREMVDSRPSLSSISRDNALDGRDPYISFRTDNPKALDRFLGGILAEDWEAIGPSMLADKKTLQNSDLISDTARPAGSSIIFPNTGYSNAISTSIYALLFSRFSTDLTLANKMRIRFEGDIGPKIVDARRISFVDPTTGFRYIASKFGNETFQGRQIETGIASRMIQRANELLAAAYVTTGAPDAFGEYVVTFATNGEPVVKDATKLKDFRRYVGLLDGVRQVGNIFGGGPLGGGGGGGDD
jgi:hypothetical protein